MRADGRSEELQSLNEKWETSKEELRETNTELVNMNKEREAFTYISSHDLQEPLWKIEKFNGKIFEVFQKLHGKDEFPGTGIGLATVKKIVDHHCGIIKVKSELDKGSTFDIYIPMND